MEPDDGICLSTLLLEVDVDPVGVVAGFEATIATVPPDERVHRAV